jgi:two-component system response regulator RegA
MIKMSAFSPVPDAHEKPLLLLVDDDEVFCGVLGRALERRGFEVMSAHGVAEAKTLLDSRIPGFAVIDLRMPDASGLELVAQLGALNSSIRIVMLTSYASIATAVEAIKLGATHYLTKPADADEIVAALNRGTGDVHTPVPDRPLSVERLEWEHLQKVLAECDGNISQASRKLGMHRRTLQRKLQKKPVRD